MTIDYSGELKWSGCASLYAPLIVDSLIKFPGYERILINFHYPGDGLNDWTSFNAQESAAEWDKKQRSLLKVWSNISLYDPDEYVYLTKWFRPYKKKDISVMLLLTLKELSGSEGQKYCYVVAYWTEDDTVYECSGLLKGCAADSNMWNGSTKG